MYKKILVAYDGSEGSQAALDHAADLAEQQHSILIIANVIKEKHPPSSQPLYRIPYGGTETEAESESRSGVPVQDAVPAEKSMNSGKGAFILRKAKNRLALPDSQIQTELLHGDPARKINDFAVLKEVNLIVMGNRGLNGFRKMMLGSVSQKVAQHAHCPVLIVK